MELVPTGGGSGWCGRQGCRIAKTDLRPALVRLAHYLCRAARSAHGRLAGTVHRDAQKTQAGVDSPSQQSLHQARAGLVPGRLGIAGRGCRRTLARSRAQVPRVRHRRLRMAVGFG